MDKFAKEYLWSQFGASIDTLESAIRACPDDLWAAHSGNGFADFWYMSFHTLFWLDYYSSETKDGFAPPSPFGLEEFDPAGLFPPRVYSKEELLTYLEFGRKKARMLIQSLTDAKARSMWQFGKRELNRVELLLYAMRHNQHHAAQLNLLLRQNIDSAPNWVMRAKQDLDS